MRKYYYRATCIDLRDTSDVHTWTEIRDIAADNIAHALRQINEMNRTATNMWPVSHILWHYDVQDETK